MTTSVENSDSEPDAVSISPAKPGPDFILIGAMKCGTTTLAAQLARQNGVFLTTPKEPNYFSDDGVFAKGPEWYSSLFDKAAPGDVRGEASTHYTKLPTYPNTLARMTTALPKLRLIYMIRNPLDRAVSHYIHEWSEGRAGRDAQTAFTQISDFVDYGRFAMQIAPFIAAYGADSVHLTSLEQITSDPDEEFARIARFLDLPSDAAWHHELPPQNVSAERTRTFPLWTLLIDTPILRTLRRALVPKAVRTLVWKMRSMDTRPELPDTLRAELERVFLADRAALADLFPDHPALDLCYPFAEPGLGSAT